MTRMYHKYQFSFKESLNIPSILKGFSHVKSFADRKASVEVKLPKDECAICGKVFGNNGNYLRHWSFHKKSHRISDALLIQRYRKFLKNAFVVVIKRKYLNKLHLCVANREKYCKSGSSGDGRTKGLAQGSIRLKCFVCHCEYVTASCLKLHMSKHKKSYCLKCGQWFYSKRRLQAHSRQECCTNEVSQRGGSSTQRSTAVDTTCGVCTKSFSSKSCLNRHMRVHTGIKPYMCDVCGSQFKERALVKKHMVVHTGIPLPKCYKCLLCNKGFTRSSILHQHMKGHGEKTLSCSNCSKKFSHIKLLNRHSLVHNERHFQCSKCIKVFVTKSNWQRHLKTHSSEKPHPCSWCGKRFRQSGNLKVHQRIHTNEKPYQCSICKRKFTQAANLKHHTSLHFEKPKLHSRQSDKGPVFKKLGSSQDDNIITIHIQPSTFNMTYSDSQLIQQ